MPVPQSVGGGAQRLKNAYPCGFPAIVHFHAVQRRVARNPMRCGASGDRLKFGHGAADNFRVMNPDL